MSGHGGLGLLTHTTSISNRGGRQCLQERTVLSTLPGAPPPDSTDMMYRIRATAGACVTRKRARGARPRSAGRRP